MIGKLLVFFDNLVFKYWLFKARKAGVKVGKGTTFGHRFWSSEPYLITIGDNCQFTKGVQIFTHGGCQVARNRFPDFDTFGKVELGNQVYIGTNALIMPGVVIGDNVLIAAGSVVCHSVPSNCIVGGNPAEIITTVDKFIEKNLPYNLNSKKLDPVSKRQLLLELPKESYVQKKMMKINSHE